MAVERRVKPTTRVMLAIKKRRAIIVACLVGVIVVGIGVGVGVHFWNQSKRNAELVTDAVATRTLLSSRTNYKGNWVNGPDGLFEIYLPGTPLQYDGFVSKAVTGERDTEYDNSLKRAYGVIVGEERFDINLFDDLSSITQSVMPKVIADVGVVCYGKNPSGGYDIEQMYMDDGRPALKVSGNVEMTLLLSDPATGETSQEPITYPILVYITLEKGYPVAVWGTWDDWDVFAKEEVPTYLAQCANTVWQTDYLGDDVEWTPIKTTVSPEGQIIYEDEPALETPEVTEPANEDGDPVGEPSPYDGPEGPVEGEDGPGDASAD